MWEVLHPGPTDGIDQQSTNYTAEVLLQQLIGKAVSTPGSYDQAEIAATFERSLNSEVILTTTPAALIETAFRIGYLYRTFLERNNVVCPKGPSSSEESITTDTEVSS